MPLKGSKKEERKSIISMTTATIVKTIKVAMKTVVFFVAGNGGSDSESHHLSSEFVTHGIRSMSLNNSATLTAIANDYSYKYVFSKQLQVLGSVKIFL